MRQRVDEDDEIVRAIEHLVREVHTPDAEVGYRDVVGQRRCGQTPRHLGAEPVIGEEDVADAGDEDTSSGCGRRRGHGYMTDIRR